MNICSPTLTKKGNRVRISSQVRWASGKVQELWVEVRASDGLSLATDTSVLASPLLLPAMWKGEEMRVEGLVSAKWRGGVSRIRDRVEGWDMGFKKIRITAQKLGVDNYTGRGVGVFFSGGVDSFSSYLKFQDHPTLQPTHFILVQGMDIDVANENFYRKVVERLRRIARHEEVKLVEVKTNARQILDPILTWELTHGGVLAMVALLLRPMLSHIIIPGSGYFADEPEEPWGSSSKLDPMWSTETLTIVHDRDKNTRLDKILTYIAHSPVALAHLRVCWHNRYYNCCACDKCLNTMVDLRIAGVLDQARSFPIPLSLAKLSKLYCDDHTVASFLNQSLFFLQSRQQDIQLQKAIESALICSQHPGFKRRMIKLVHDWDEKYLHNSLYFMIYRFSGVGVRIRLELNRWMEYVRRTVSLQLPRIARD